MRSRTWPSRPSIRTSSTKPRRRLRPLKATISPVADAEVDRFVARQTPADGPGARPAAATGLIVALSGRNRLRGFVEEVRIDGLLGQVRLRIGDQRLTAVITGDAIQELKLRRGDDALAIIKSTEVMIAREAEFAPPSAKRRRRRSA